MENKPKKIPHLQNSFKYNLKSMELRQDRSHIYMTAHFPDLVQAFQSKMERLSQFNSPELNCVIYLCCFLNFVRFLNLWIC